MVVAMICREMKWTYEEYMNQPLSFVNHIIGMMSEEAKHNNRRYKK